MDANMMHVAGILCFDLETARSKAKSNAGRSNTSSITSWEFLARVLVYNVDFFLAGNPQNHPELKMKIIFQT